MANIANNAKLTLWGNGLEYKVMKTIYVDVDGTIVGKNGSLLHNHLGENTTASLDGIRLAHENDCEIVIATGRDLHRAADFVRVLGLQKVIAELGCVIRTTDEDVFNFGEANKYFDFTKTTAEELHEHVVEASEFLVEQFPGVIQLHSEYNKGQFATTMLRGEIDEKKANELMKDKWPYLEIHANGHGMFRRTMPGVENVLIYHLAPIGVTKAGGVEFDQKLRNLKKEDCFMIGDGYADLVVSPFVNTVYVPVNGVKSDSNSKAYADSHDNVVVVESSHNEGFLEAIKLIIS